MKTPPQNRSARNRESWATSTPRMLTSRWTTTNSMPLRSRANTHQPRACADRGFGAFASIHDPIADVVLLCTLSAFLAVGCVYSNVERAAADKRLPR